MERERPKICPLLANCPDFAVNKIKCIGDRCAWWYCDCCALVSFARNTGDVAMWVEEISGTQQDTFDRQYPRMARRGPVPE